MTEGVHDRRTDSEPLPPFSRTTAAQPVVPLAKISFREKMGTQWLLLQREFGRFLQNRRQVQVLALVIGVGLLGGIAGGFTAARQQPTPTDATTMMTYADTLAKEESQPVLTETSPQVEATRSRGEQRSQLRRVRRSQQAYQFAVIYGEAFFDRDKKRRKGKRFRGDDDD